MHIANYFCNDQLSRIGAKIVIVSGLLFTGTATVLFGYIENAPSGRTFFLLSVAIRAIEGAGFAAYFTAVLAIIIETFPADPGYFVVSKIENVLMSEHKLITCRHRDSLSRWSPLA